MLQPYPCLHEFKKRDQSLVFMMTIQLTQGEFSQFRTPHGSQSSSQFNWQRSQSSSTYRDYNGGSTSQDDDNNNRSSGRPSYSKNYQQESYRSLIEVMATPEDIISQRVTVSLNQNGCSLDQAVKRNLWSLMKKIKMCVFNIVYVFTKLSLLHITRAKTTPFIALLEQNFNVKHTLHVLM